MSLVTTCPACATAFVVTTAQLSAHRGDVRCGKCMHIFNGLAQLTEIDATQTTPNSPAFPEPEFTEAVLVAPPPSDEPLPDHGTVDSVTGELIVDTQHLDFELDFTEATEQENPQTASADLDLTQQNLVEPQNIEDISTFPPTPEDLPSPNRAIPVETETAALPTEPPLESANLFAKPTKRGGSGWAYSVISVILLLAASAQTAYFLRTEISASYPPARPLLAQACEWLQCQIDLPRRAELFNIQDSDLQDDPEHQDVLILSSVLANHASFAQTYPLLEVTLTDTQDKAIIRKTLTPRDYLPAGTDLKAGLAGNGEIHSQLYLAVEGMKPVGYRLFVRY